MSVEPSNHQRSFARAAGNGFMALSGAGLTYVFTQMATELMTRVQDKTACALVAGWIGVATVKFGVSTYRNIFPGKDSPA